MNYYLSAARLEELKKELVELKTVKRIEISDRIKKAKEYGDLSENAEYENAREEQDRIESRIEELEDIIKSAVTIKKATQQETVDIGSTVEVARNGEKRKVVIVGSNETRPEEGLISNESPLGRALLGKKVGDEAVFKNPAGKEITYLVTKIGE
ncbi:MAG: transcription elongation factor GreA [Patescibacteria group bacterium]|nr:transcription elongation factor GreA [Patescibacteria group bacterium]MCL5261946.1 transcription elongation factor GreA [Patescibacteria group bacterium]